MAREFLGKGWRYPVGLDGNGQVSVATYDESVRQAIWTILGTARGERVMRPDFGCGIHDMVFAVNNAMTAGLLAEEARQALLLWEPRADVLDVQVAPGGAGEVLFISIRYQVRSTNNVFNLVYPFYLERSAG